MNDIAKPLYELMKEKEIERISDLSKQVKIPIDTLYKYFDKENIPSIKNLVKLCDYFNCSTDFIMGLTDDPTRTGKDTNKSFIENYRFLLDFNKTTNYKVCKDLGIHKNRLRFWTKGTTPYVQTLIPIAKYFDTTLDFLLGRTDIF